MAVNCYLTLNSQVIYVALPFDRYKILIREQKRMLNGQMRTAHRAEKYGFVLSVPDATEAQRTAILAAASTSTSISFTDETGTARTVVVQDVADPLARTVPAVEGGTSTTGPGYYDLSITLEEV